MSAQGVCPPKGGVYPGGCLPKGRCLPGGCVPRDVSARHPPLVDRMTDASENITLPQLCCGR